MANSRLSRFVLVVWLLIVPAAIYAHHSRAEFSPEMLEMVGELVSIDWSNPHPILTLRVTADGDEALWEIQGYGSLYTLTRAGVTGEHLTAGDRVRLMGQLSTRREQLFLVSNMLLPDGTEIVFNRHAQPVWADSAVGGNANWVAGEGDLVDTVAENRGIFRLWSQPEENRTTIVPPLTQEAAAAQASWDAMDDTSMRCIPKGMPRAMLTPHPYELVDNGDTITVLGHEFNVVRTIHLSDPQDPASQPLSPLGYSIGRWEGGTLVVETSRVNWPTFSGSGIPLSEAVEIVERFTLSEDQSRLNYHVTVTDPATFTAPATIETYWVALGETVEPYDCKIDG